MPETIVKTEACRLEATEDPVTLEMDGLEVCLTRSAKDGVFLVLIDSREVAERDTHGDLPCQVGSLSLLGYARDAEDCYVPEDEDDHFDEEEWWGYYAGKLDLDPTTFSTVAGLNDGSLATWERCGVAPEDIPVDGAVRRKVALRWLQSGYTDDQVTQVLAEVMA